MQASTAEKRAAFRALHTQGCFAIPNPWDVGSARYLQGLGFKALATTSSGFAWSLGHSDGALPRDVVLEHLRELAAATSVPLNADFEDGYGTDVQGVTESVRLAVETGVAGLSIEDSTGDAAQPLYDIDVAVARLRAARKAIDDAGGGVLLTGRAENFFVGRPDLDDTVARLKAYAAAGADCLYAPGIHTREQIMAVVTAVAPRPVNLLVGSSGAFTLQDIAALGVRRVSVGGGLARVAWGGFMRAARALAGEGSFNGFSGAAPGESLNSFFRLSVEECSTKRSAEILGKVEYRDGDGPLRPIPVGTVEVETTPLDAIVSWVEGDGHGVAGMPVADFCQYVGQGAIRIA
jgi:2-methylisocitrate lyase-like PEP mutase family enzyme